MLEALTNNGGKKALIAVVVAVVISWVLVTRAEDDLKEEIRMRDNQIRAELLAMRHEQREFRTEIRREFRALRREIHSLNGGDDE